MGTSSKQLAPRSFTTNICTFQVPASVARSGNDEAERVLAANYTPRYLCILIIPSGKNAPYGRLPPTSCIFCTL
jgi:hypothetical protein